MFGRLYIPSGRNKYLFGLIILVFISGIWALVGTGDKSFDIARREVLLRKLGDELLSQSGDTTSRVLPVKQITANEYQISFEKELAFFPDSLVNITRRIVARDPLAGDYVVNVLNSGNSSVAYGYAIAKNKKNDIIACSGRKQPKAPYTIDIKYEPAGINTAKGGYILGSLSFLALVGFVFFRPGRRSVIARADQKAGILHVGSAFFDAKKRELTVKGNTIDLTDTESRILLIFAQSPNQIIERSRLQKEIWEDEGVIVGRSLDMFISKLRKKFEPDPNVNIVVVRGKGYKLELIAFEDKTSGKPRRLLDGEI